MENSITNYFSPQVSYHVSNIFRQLWDNSDFNYLDIPRSECGLLLVTQGSITYSWENQQLIAKAGDLLFLSQGCHYRAHITSAEDYLINFRADITLPPCSPIRLLREASGDYIDIFQRLVELKLQGNCHSFSADAQLLLLLERIETDLKKQKNTFLGTALPLLADPSIPIREIAQHCGISDSGFRAQFKKAMGLSPLQYRLNARIRKAQYLLESTDLSIQQIAEQLHFYDQAYFCKLFRQKTGVSPKFYAKSQKM